MLTTIGFPKVPPNHKPVDVGEGHFGGDYLLFRQRFQPRFPDLFGGCELDRRRSPVLLFLHFARSFKDETSLVPSWPELGRVLHDVMRYGGCSYISHLL